MEEQTRVISNYLIGRKIGEGNFGRVYLGRHISSKESVALKIIPHFSADDERSKNKIRNVEREIRALQALHHPNIIQLFSVHRDATFPKRNGNKVKVYLFALQYLEYELFQLFNTLQESKILSHQGLEERVAKAYFRQLLSALEHCHAHGVYHRDIKPENVLLDGHFQLKLGDFGLAWMDIEQEGSGADVEQVLISTVGTPAYASPELFGSRRSGRYSGPPHTHDVWSAGVCLFWLLVGRIPFNLPFSGDQYFKLLMEGRHHMFWAGHLRNCEVSVSIAAQGFLNRIFTVSPLERATIEDLYNDEWLQHDYASLPELSIEMGILYGKLREKNLEECQRVARKIKMRQKGSGKQSQEEYPRKKFFSPFNNLNRKRSLKEMLDGQGHPTQCDGKSLEAAKGLQAHLPCFTNDLLQYPMIHSVLCPTDLYRIMANYFYSSPEFEVIRRFPDTCTVEIKSNEYVGANGGTFLKDLAPQDRKNRHRIGHMEIIALLYRVDIIDDVVMHAIVLKRKSGDSFLFQQKCKVILSNLKQLTSDQFESQNHEESEEGLLLSTDSIGLI